LSVFLSDRHFGVGGDGVVLILPSTVADVRMRMFNLDGSEGRMCGNAARCVAKFVYDRGLVRRDRITIETLSGIKEVEVFTANKQVKTARVNMGRAILAPKEIPVRLSGTTAVNRPVEIGGKEYRISCVSMGNPHCVVFCEDIKSIRLDEVGPEFENSPLFPERVNAEFVKIIAPDVLELRVWERGSGETLACGTGACASVVAATLLGYCQKDTDVKVILKGGELTIRYTDDAVYMSGGCEKVFEGTVLL
jgi:carbamoyl-phosphate synthase large subunit